MYNKWYLIKLGTSINSGRHWITIKIKLIGKNNRNI